MNNGWHNQIINHDVTKTFPLEDSCIDVCITSPPYWGLRDYGVDGQIGLEKHPSEYIDKMVGVCREIHRVLKKSGSFYLNLGDTYCGSGGGRGGDIEKCKESTLVPKAKGVTNKIKYNNNWLQPKQLMLIPMRVAIALQDDGWILRNDIIWHKPNPMPSSVKDRLNNTFEHVFHFVKSRKYYYDLDSIRKPHATSTISRYNYPLMHIRNNAKGMKVSTGYHCDKDVDLNPLGKNPGDVIGGAILGESGAIKVPGGKGWTKSVPGGGNACAKDPRWCPPEGKNPGDIVESWNWISGMDRDETEIIEIRVNMPSQKDFVDYLKPKTKLYEKELDDTFTDTKWRHWIRYDETGFAFPSIEDWKLLKTILNLDDTFDLTKTQQKQNAVINNPRGKTPGDFWNICTQPFTSYSSELEHFAVFPEELILKPIKASCPKDGVVFDPFCGRGTVGKVARDLGLNYVLFDIKPEYCELARLYVAGQKRKLIKYQQKLRYDET